MAFMELNFFRSRAFITMRNFFILPKPIIMKNSIFIFLTLFVFSNFIWAQNNDVLLINQISGTGNCEIAVTQMDNNGNVYITGRYDGEIAQGAFSFTAVGNYDAFVAKYNNNGEILWLKTIGSTGAEKAIGLVLSNDGSFVYVSGQYANNCDFDGTNLTTDGGANSDIYLAKYTSDGTLVWAYDAAYGTDVQTNGGITVDQNDDLIMVGNFKTDVIFAPGVNQLLAPLAFTQSFIAKFDSDGNNLWSTLVDGDDNLVAFRTVTADNNGYYISGYFRGNVNFPTGTLTSVGTLDGFLYKVNTTGVGQWARQVRGNGNDYFWQHKSDNLGNIYSIGYFGSTDLTIDSTAAIPSAVSVTNQGSNDMFLICYAADGTLQSFRTYGGTNDDRGYGIDVNNSNIAISGVSLGEVDFNPYTLPDGPNSDAFMVEMDKSYNIVSFQYGTGDLVDICQKIMFDAVGKICVLGEFTSTDFSIENHVLLNANPGSRDGFISKFGRINLAFTVTDDSCNAGGTGAVDLTVSGDGRPPYTYVWNDPGASTTQDITGLSTGWYTVTMTDFNGAIKIDSAFVDEPAEFQVLSSTISATCGASNGSIDIIVSGGTTPYSYLWDDIGGSMTQDISGLEAGTYHVTITDALGCSTVDSATVGTNNTLSLFLIPTNENCGNSDGAINLVVSGSTGSETFLWSNASTDEDISGLAAGIYTVTVTDGLCSKEGTTVVGYSGNPSASLYATNPTCLGGDGEINLVVSGGTPPYSYSWSNASTDEDLTGLNANVYNVTVTDAVGCTTTGTAVLSVPNGPSLSTYSTDPSCSPGSDGTVNLVVSGGLLPYSYSWSNASTDEDLAGLTANTYYVTVTDGNSCTSTTQAVLVQPSGPTVSLYSSNPTCSPGSDGSVDLVVTGGLTPYSYLWSDASTDEDLAGLSANSYLVTVTDANGCTNSGQAVLVQPSVPTVNIYTTNATCSPGNDGAVDLVVTGGANPYSYAWSDLSTDEDLSGLSAATYSVTVTDAYGCSNTGQAVVSDATPPVLNLYNTNPTCANNNGSIDLVVTGGVTPYSYNWTNLATTQDISGLSSGFYSVTVTDGSLCTSTGTVALNTPASPNVVLIGANPTCAGFDGTVLMAISGGATPYQYNWSNAATTQNIAGLNAGSYTVTVTDANLCTSLGFASLSSPQYPSVSTLGNDPSCAGGDGSIDISVTGGSTPYSFNWSNAETTEDLTGIDAGSYTVTISDVNNCETVSSLVLKTPNSPTSSLVVTDPSCLTNDGEIDLVVTGGTLPYQYIWDTPITDTITSQDLTGQVAGTYIVTVTDAQSCTSIASTVLSLPPNPGVTLIEDNPSCNGGDGAIDLVVTGGTIPFTYIWSNAATTEDLTGLSAGIFTVTVSDKNYCKTFGSVVLSTPSGPSVGLLGYNPGCTNDNGSIDLVVSGGLSPYTYQWTNSDTDQDPTGLSAGLYAVTVTDANFCESVGSAALTLPNGPAATVLVTNPSCLGGDGEIDITVGGGLAPYGYLWSTTQTDEDITGLSIGVYSVTVTDANGCTLNTNAILSAPSVPNAGLVVTNPSCDGGDGAINLVVSGGSQPYTYLWSNDSITEDLSMVNAGIYSVTITDANFCEVVGSAVLSTPQGPNVSLVQTNPSCPDGDGEIDAYVSGGTTPYSYLWDNMETTASVTGLMSGVHYVTVSDGNNCISVDSVELVIPNSPDLVLIPASPTVGASNGSVNLVVIGGIAPYSYAWSTGATSEDISGLAAGMYYVTVIDGNLCQTEDSVEVAQPPGTDLVLFMVHENPLCPGDATSANITTTVLGGVQPYSYLWSNGEITSSVDSLGAGWYTVTVSDAIGTSIIDSVKIQDPAGMVPVLVNNNPECYGGNDGSVNLYVINGSSPFAYVWSNGETTQNIDGVVSGTYYVTISDANGCVVDDSVELSDPAELLLFVESTDVSCFGGSDGTAGVSVYNGILPLSYSWSTGESTASAQNLMYGTYYITASDARGCSVVDSVLISSPAELSTSFMTVDPTCDGINDGSIDLSVTLGTSPYTFEWNDEGGAITEDIANLGDGTYVVTVTDDQGCSKVDSIDLNNSTVLNATLSSTDPACLGLGNGSASISMDDGTAPFTYEWSTGSMDTIISGLIAGEYMVTVVDSNGCNLIETITLVYQDTIYTTISTVDPTCTGIDNGLAAVTAVGNNSPFTYAWSDYNSQVTDTAFNLSAGTYYVTVRDAIGCMAYDSASLSNTSPLSVTFTITDAYCSTNSNGSLEADVQNATGPVSFEWSTGSNDTLISGLSYGQYQVTITDSLDCMIVDSATVDVMNVLSLTLQGSDPTCFGLNDGAASAMVTGAIDPISYLWSTGDTTMTLSGLTYGEFILTATDDSNCVVFDTIVLSQPDSLVLTLAGINVSCFGFDDGSISMEIAGGTSPYLNFNWSNGDITQNADSLSEDIYYITITDNNGCTAVDSMAITEPVPLLVEAETSGYTCNGQNGSVSLSVAGGMYPYNILWSNGDTMSDLTELENGTYYYSITDMNGCMFADSVILDIDFPMTVTVDVQADPSCYGYSNGSIGVTATGGLTPYLYMWYDQDSVAMTGSSLAGLSSGSYFLTVYDSVGCTSTQTIILTDPVQISVNGTIQDALCYADSTGQISISAVTGVSPITYNWITGDDEASIDSLGAGTYSVTVTDANSCFIVQNYTVSQPTLPLSVSSEVVYDMCSGSEESITVTAFGGTEQYTFLWSDSTSSQELVLADSTVFRYTITVTDANLCYTTESFQVSHNPGGLNYTSEILDETCMGKEDGSIQLTVVSGTAPYQYSWSSGETSSLITGLAGGTYTVTITDNNECEVSSTFEVEGSIQGCLVIRNAFTPNGDGKNEVWNIKGIEDYPTCTVEVFNQWGKKVFDSEGYAEPWDGTTGGKALPSATYYYVIDLGDDSEVLSGSVSIIK